MKLSDIDGEPQACLDQLSRLQTALCCLGWTWVSVPGLLLLASSGSGDSIGFICCYLVVFTLISGFLLARSAESRLEALKIVGIPSLFIGAILLSILTDLNDLTGFGILGIFLAPLWLVEILRVRAARYGFNHLSLTLLGHHFFCLYLAWDGYFRNQQSEGLVLLWYGLHIVYFAWFFHLLKEPAAKLRAVIAPPGSHYEPSLTPTHSLKTHP